MSAGKHQAEVQALKCEIIAGAFSEPPSREYIADTDFSLLSDSSRESLIALNLIFKERAELTEDRLRAIRVDYTAICCSTKATSPLPYRSIYEGPQRLLMRDCCTQISQEYERYGFASQGEISHEPADFLSTMLLFLAQRYRDLAFDVAEGNESNEAAAAHVERFKKNNLARWVPRYCSEARSLVTTGFYKGMLRLTSAFAAAEEVFLYT